MKADNRYFKLRTDMEKAFIEIKIKPRGYGRKKAYEQKATQNKNKR